MSSISHISLPSASMKSYDTFQSIKRATTNHLREIASPEMSRVSTVSGGRVLPLLSALLLSSTCCGFVFFSGDGRRMTSTDEVGVGTIAASSSTHLPILASSVRNHASSTGQHTKSTRTYNTKADEYYKQFNKLPTPLIMHDNLRKLLSQSTKTNDDYERTNKVLLIGDVHGCLDELKSLVAKASRTYNKGKQFASIVLVGDLCNKGPYSAEVVRYVREQPFWYSIRGNHDNAALEAALGDPDRLAKERYAWVKQLSDDDVEWMAGLPYTIRVPKDLISSDEDVLVVHAGLIPNVGMDSQAINTMLTVRNLTLVQNSEPNGNHTAAIDQYEYYNSIQTENAPIPVAKAWPGPELVIFGHDAKRGIQLEKHAIGLDSGCVYGNKLTGIVFPEKELVSVDAAEVYCPVGGKC